MQSAAVICELNPFHNGHAYMLSEMRKAVGEDGCVLCLMSGRFVQRGSVALADPYLRAETALKGGADLVLELPFPWSAGSADFFAQAGVRILNRLRIGTLFFGSESGDSAPLRAAASAVSTALFSERFAHLARTGIGTAAAYAQALSDMLAARPDVPTLFPSGIPADFPSPNDLLGIAYLKATENCPFPVSVQTVQRRGQSDTEDTLTDVDYPSATALRTLVYEAQDDPDCLDTLLDGTMPAVSRSLLTGAVRNGDAPLRTGDIPALARMLFRLAAYDEEKRKAISTCAEMGGGLAGFLFRAALRSADVPEFLRLLRTRQFTDARIRRAMLFAVLGVRTEDLQACPAYTTVLAADRIGCRFMKEWRIFESSATDQTTAGQDGRDAPFDIVTKPSSAPDGRQKQLGQAADALFTACFPHPKPAGFMMTRTPLVTGSAGESDSAETAHRHMHPNPQEMSRD